MGLFNLFGGGADINRGVADYKATEGAVLVDVREVDEFKGGHIPGAINVPLSTLNAAEAKLKDKSAPLFVYCLSGSRSMQATGLLQRMGYENVRNLGGIADWAGEIVTD